MKSHDLRIRIQRTPSFQIGDCDQQSRSPLPLHSSPALQSPLLSAGSRLDPSAKQVEDTPPTTPMCGGSFSLLGAELAPGGAGAARRSLPRRNSSCSSASSSAAGDDEEDLDEEWTEEEKEKLWSAFDEAVESVDHAPFSQAGPPPSNLTHVVARNVIASSKQQARVSSSDVAVENWRHGLKSTRQKLLTLVKERQTAVEATPTQTDPDATPRRVNMARQGSMDFLPAARNVGRAAKLGDRLQRAEPTGPPPAMSRNLSTGLPARPRFERTTSLSTIAGSPSQPKLQPSSSRMARMNSDTSGVSTGFEFDMSRLQASAPRANPLFGLSLDSGHTTKRASPGLGSAFTSPALGTSFSPSSSSHKKKAKFTHHSPTNSLELPQQSLAEAFGSTAPQALSLALGESLNLGPSMKARERSGGSLGASSSFYQTDAQSNGSISSVASSSDSRRSSTSFFTAPALVASSASLSSLTSASSIEADDTLGVDSLSMTCGTPSPLTFDYSKEPRDYFAAGDMAQDLRDRMGNYGWNRS